MKLVLLLFLFLSINLTAQETQYFVRATESFSHKKNAYITMNDGSEIEGTIKKIKWKKGLFVEMKLMVDGEKNKYTAEEISHMYLPQSGLDGLIKGLDVAFDATQWAKKSDVNGSLIQDGYAYFEVAEVQIKKKKTQMLLLQVLNPAFNSEVKVFYDPFANETVGVGFAGIKVAGGIDKSYWVQYGDKPAFKLKKKKYDEEAEMLFGGCEEYYNSIKSDLKWKNFPKQVYDFTEACN